MISIVTDSGSMLTDELQRRYSISIVPMTITVDGREFTEGAELTTAEFYARLSAGSAVSTAAPSPGVFVDAYRAAADAGATAVLSIHTGAAYSATIASATVAAGLVDVTVVFEGCGELVAANLRVTGFAVCALEVRELRAR